MSKRIVSFVLALIVTLSGIPMSEVNAQGGKMEALAMEAEVPIQTASGRDGEYAVELDGTWKFGGRGLTESQALSASYDTWENVSIPHTWNATDAEDGGGNYARTAYWYHKEFVLDEKFAGKRIYIEFLGANTKTDLYVNGTKAGDTHKGGYTAFRYDITDYVKAQGSNRIDVKVDNTSDQDIAPISADFNFYGGIYRRVYLIAAEDVHVDLGNYGSCGMFLTTGNMRSKEAPADLGEFSVKTDIVNESNAEKKVTVITTVLGDNAPNPVEKQITIPAGGKVPYSEKIKIENPHLWNGIDYSRNADNEDIGYQYTVSLEIKDGQKVLDKVTDKLGFRYFYVDKNNGFYLNGKPHALRGVNRHQFWKGMGSAITEEEHRKDMEIMMDLGVNAIRLSHYPQTDYFYDLCDENGIIVWTEIPLVNELGTGSGFFDVAKQQLTELIRQQYNRPSVCFWGLQNEIGNRSGMTDVTNSRQARMKELIYQLDALAKQEDTTGRYTTQAVNRDYSMDQNQPESVNSNFSNNIGWKSDLVSWNIYPGWYPDNNFYGTFEDVMVRKTALDSRSMGISEYGWGSNINQHELYPELGKNELTSGGRWHPEEYQNLMHEEALEYINAHDELWGTFLWVMFDFAVDSRNEGSQIALNDKGLVTGDRKFKKDSYYLYKANWNKKDLFTYITSRRYANRDEAESYIKVYSNCDEVELFINGISLGNMEARGNGVFQLDQVSLPNGNVTVRAVGSVKGEAKSYEDECIWTRALSTKAEIKSDVFAINHQQKTLVMNREITLKELKEAVTGVNHAVYDVYDGETKITEDTAKILPGMKLKVVAEDQVTTAVYVLTAGNLCVNKPVTVSSFEQGNTPQKAVDADSATRWTAVDGTYPQWITVDLEDEFYLGSLTLDWDSREGKRNYQYYVEISADGVNYTEVIDRRSNTVSGSVADNFKEIKGRYIRVTAVGCNQSGWASLYEMKADGYKITSDTYTIDQENHLILLDRIPEGGLAEGDFASNINITGNYSYRINLSSGWINVGDTLEVIDAEGKATAFVICTPETKGLYTNLALNKLVYCSSEEGISTQGKSTVAENAVDGNKETAWTAFVNNGTNGAEDARYPEWLCVDLGDVYEIGKIDLQFEAKGGRTYDYRIYTSLDTVPEEKRGDIPQDYTMIFEKKDNKESGVQQSLPFTGKTARYVLVEITKCSAYSSQAKYVAASIYELVVYGKSLTADKADKTDLLAALADAERIENAGYTEESWTKFQEAIAKAKQVAEVEDASQEEVDAAKKGIEDAKADLETTPVQPPKKTGSIKFSKITFKIAAGKKVKLASVIILSRIAAKNVTYISSNKKYADVNKKGVVTLKNAGAGKKVTITAKAKDNSAKSAKVTIQIMKHAVTKISLKASAKTVKAGKKLKVKATVRTNGKKANKVLEWSTSNKKYATVNSKGVVTAKKAGKGKTVKITAKSTDGTNKKATIKINIKK